MCPNVFQKRLNYRRSPDALWKAPPRGESVSGQGLYPLHQSLKTLPQLGG